MKKVLIISPTPTHPQNAGNRSRIYNTSATLINEGLEVHFLFVEYESADVAAMQKFWGDKLHILSEPAPGVRNVQGKIINKISHYISRAKLVYYRLKYGRPYSTYNRLVDDNYCFKLDEVVKKLHNEFEFDIVLVEYVYLSRVLLNFGKSVVKLIDTHDILTDRFKIFLDKGLSPQWYSLYKEEERKGLNRADFCIAIQEREKVELSKITTRKILLFGHTVIVPEYNNPEPLFDKRLIFVASDNFINIEGINHFIKAIFSTIKEQHRDIKLLLAGSIINARKDIIEDKNIYFIGQKEDIGEAYKAADIVINPVRIGTGLKIKSIEAMAYGKPFVSFKSGISGMESLVDFEFCLISNSDNEFMNHVLLLIENEQKRAELTKASLKFTEVYNGIASSELLNLLGK